MATNARENDNVLAQALEYQRIACYRHRVTVARNKYQRSGMAPVSIWWRVSSASGCARAARTPWRAETALRAYAKHYEISAPARHHQ